MYFYGLAALGLVLPVKDRWSVLVAWLSVSVIAGSLLNPTAPVPVFLTNPVFIEFGFGVILARYLLDRQLDVAGLIAIAAAILALLLTNPTSRALLAGLPAVVLVGIVAAGEMKGWGANGTLVRVFAPLGDASYSLYLIQLLTVPACAKLAVIVAPSIDVLVFVMLTLVISTVASLFLYHLVERPLQRGLRRSQLQTVGTTARSS